MNALTTFISSIGLDPIKAMNELQDAGIVSDNCVTTEDVGRPDVFRAMKWLDEKYPQND